MLEIKILKDSNYLWADIKGKLIIEEDGKNMFEQINSNISEKCSNIVLNLKELEYINSSGFNNLLKILTNSRNIGGDTFLCNINSVIETLLITTKLNTIFKVENQIENLKDFINKQ
ncbi:MAG: STAS domain-containing protein [Flavobacteriales bacterium]|jgi:anti-anti-sigma factor|tara:strand:+ start:2215 stop:2562 length:348 start_codon:yes stop_codon:yes gene_type:complete